MSKEKMGKIRIISEKKKFKIIEDSSPRWEQQKNANDCGPAMLLNIVRVLGLRSIASDIPAVRAIVSNMADKTRMGRSDAGVESLAIDGWFTNGDVKSYLEQHLGMSVTQYSCFSGDKSKILASIQEQISQGFRGIFFTNHRHFVAVVRGSNGLLLLDSFRSGPETVTMAEVHKMIDASFVDHPSGRVETVAFFR